jgi:hypothetical protein
MRTFGHKRGQAIEEDCIMRKVIISIHHKNIAWASSQEEWD